MLAKMGWSKGKGLGANENGTQDFIRVRYKNDIGGLGFSARDDQWTENELTFNALLKNLNEESGEVAENGEAPETSSKIKSLEEKSKKSRTRVHYQKFTRGKDLSRYSSKDLANIFGKKSLNESYKIEKEDESSSGSVPETTEIVEDSKMINTGVSITDYFKSKRQNIAAKNGEETVNGDEKVSTEPSEEPKVVQKKKKRKSKKKKSDDDEGVDSNPSSSDDKTAKSSEEEIKSEQERVTQELETVSEAPEKKKKSKKAKRKDKSEDVVENIDDSQSSSITDKKESKRKTSSEEEDLEAPEVPNEPPTKKSKKRRLSNETNNTSDVNETKIQKTDPEPATTTTTITIGSDPNKFFLDAVAVEKLKYLRLEKFRNSNVANIVGYGLSKDIKLEVCDSSIVKGVSHVNKYSIYANVDKMHSKKYYKSLLLRYHKKRNTFKM